MDRLTIPEPKIALYEEGFSTNHDKLERKSTADALSNLVDRIEDPMVIALDGGWGSGKSFFLKCWVGHHILRDANTAQTVYFDAFANDFMDEPLVSLMACILDRFDDLGTDQRSKLDKAKDIAWRLGPSALRIGASLATFGATTVLNETGDTVAKAIGGEIHQSSKSFWKEAQERQGVMHDFRDAVSRLTKDADDTPRKLIIVVDELDRCRPDYALALLEIIKYFFAVDHIHFVLGVNLLELENSVKARYGGGINASLYLQKFVTLTMTLPDQVDGYAKENTATLYLNRLSKEMGLSGQQHRITHELVHAYKDKHALTLRGMQRLLSIIAISRLPSEASFIVDTKQMIVLHSAAILKAWNRPLYLKALSGDIRIPDLIMAFNMEEGENGKHSASHELKSAWSCYLEPEDASEGNPRSAKQSLEYRLQVLRETLQKTLETFALPTAT